MKSTTKRTLSIIFQCTVVVLLIAAALYFIPWPTRVDVQMTGIEVAADGTPIHEQTVHLQGWKLNYLFQDDTVNLDIQVNGANGLQLNAVKNAPIYPLSDKVDCSSWFVYMDDTNRMEVLSVYLDKDLNWLVFSVCDRYFVAAADANADLQAYWEMYADYIR